jgi:hypothetical protein
LLRHIIEISVHGGVIEGVDHRRLSPAASLCDLLGNGFQAFLRSAGQKDSRAFRRKLFRDGSADRSSPAPDARLRPWFSMGEFISFIVFAPFVLGPSTCQRLKTSAADIFFRTLCDAIGAVSRALI